MTWRAELEATLGKIKRIAPVHGGSINDVWRVELVAEVNDKSDERRTRSNAEGVAEVGDKRLVFVKSHRSPPPGMYAAEAAGLAWLRPGPVRVPRVIAAADAFLALEWMELGPLPEGHVAEEALGRGLAGLHALGAPSFGLAHDNFLATIPQDNTPAPDLQTFYIERRLRPLFDTIRLGPNLPDLRARLDALRGRPELFGPPEPPARLHGDLWSGNVGLCEGEPVIFDPAVYGGHREIDLAMLHLFGGLSDRLVAAYQEVAPLAEGWRERVESLWRLYPLAAHAVLFGGGYVGRTTVTLDALLASR